MSDETIITPSPQHFGRYEIVRELGRGAMGVVYEAYDPNIKRRVAIKTARPDAFSNPALAEEMMTRFIREAQAAGALNHPNIITIYDTGEHDGVSFIVMEYIEGGSLHEQLASGHRWDPSEVVQLGATLAEALAAAHERGIVHRDIKPANIMLAGRGLAKIADFGIAHTSDSTLTRQGDMIGTPYYMSPEQFQGQKVDARSDLFSLAIILYEMLTAERPFRGQAVNTVMHECLKSVPTPPQELNFAVPPVLGAVILKALEKSPMHRYQNGLAFAEALRESLKESPNPAITKVTADDATLVGAAPAGAAAVAEETPASAIRGDEAEEEIGATTEFQWTRRHSIIAAAAGIAAVILGASLYAGGGETSPYVGKLVLRAYGISDQGCYDRWDNTTETVKSLGCAESVQPVATACNADDGSDCIAPMSFEDTKTIELAKDHGKHWKRVRVTFALDGYVTTEAITASEASEPGDTETIVAVLVSNGVNQGL